MHELIAAINKKLAELGLSVEKLSVETAISKMTIYNIFSGRSKPSLSQTEKLANALGLKLTIKEEERGDYILVSVDDDSNGYKIERIHNGSKMLIEKFYSQQSIELENNELPTQTALLNAVSGDYILRKLKPYIYSGAEVRIKI